MRSPAQQRAIDRKKAEMRKLQDLGGGKEVARVAFGPSSNSNIHGVDITDDDLPSFIREDGETNISNAHSSAPAPKPSSPRKPPTRHDGSTIEAPPVTKLGPAAISEAEAAKAFVLAGNAYFTVRSQATGTRFTFRVSLAAPNEKFPSTTPRWFVSLLNGPENTSDYAYMGMIERDAFRLTRGSRVGEDAPSFKAFRWVWQHLAIGAMPPKAEIWHEGRCGRCGRKLTVPESIARGIGPECAGMM